MVLLTIPLLLLLLSFVDRGLACMDYFRPNAHSMLLISITLALTVILLVACLILLYIPL